MKETVLACVQEAGSILHRRFGHETPVRHKENQSSVVTEADLAAEKRMIHVIRAAFPEHGIVAEESGWQPGPAEILWVVDPLDGTSNFAAGVPWYGPMVAVLERGVPVLGAMYLPELDVMYYAERNRGVTRNGVPVRTTPEPDLGQVLCAYSLDASADENQTRRETDLLARIVARVRNIRSTNCLLDFCYTIDGRFGACVNQATRIWDIAPALLMFREAGGLLTDLQGRGIDCRVDAGCWNQTHAVVGGSARLHAQMLELTRPFGAPSSP